MALALGRRSHFDLPSDNSSSSSYRYSTDAPAPSEQEEAEKLAARRKFEQEMEAFQEMMGYNMDVAYGLRPKSEDEE